MDTTNLNKISKYEERIHQLLFQLAHATFPPINLFDETLIQINLNNESLNLNLLIL